MSLTSGDGFGAAVRDPVTVGVVLGLVAGKTIGVAGAAWLVHRFTRAELARGIGWWDVVGLAMLDGVGLTVSLLIGELAFGLGTPRDEHAKLASCWVR